MSSTLNIITEQVQGPDYEWDLTPKRLVVRIANRVQVVAVTVPDEPDYVKEWFSAANPEYTRELLSPSIS